MKRIIRKLFPTKRDTIEKEIWQALGVSRKEVTSLSKKEDPVMARMLYYYIMRETTHFTFEKIASRYGQTAHTAMHGYKRTRAILRSKDKYTEVIKSVIERMPDVSNA